MKTNQSRPQFNAHAVEDGPPNGVDPESPHVGSRYIPGSANGQPAPTTPLRFRRKALSPSERAAALGKD